MAAKYSSRSLPSVVATQGAALAVAGLFAAGAQAQGAGGGLEEITVTARRTEESIQSVPVSITAFDEKAMREAQISDPEDIQLNTPGVHLSGSGSRQNVIYQIRGQSKSVSGPSSAAVVSYFAEVPDPVFGSFVPQYDIASIQVLKGPQGTLFGRNTTGGALLYTPTEPGHEFGGYVMTSFGNYDKRQGQGALNIPITDVAALRIAGDVHRRDGWSKNIGVGKDMENVDSKSVRVSLLLEPTDGIKNVTIYDYFESDSDGFAQRISGLEQPPSLPSVLGLYASVLDQFTQQQARDFRTLDTSVDTFETVQRTGVTNRTEVELGPVNLTNIFGYRNSDVKYVQNVDGMGVVFGDGTVFPAGLPINFIKSDIVRQYAQYSNELQLRGQALDDKMDWLVGAFWLKSEPDGSDGSTVAFAEPVGFPIANAGYNFIEEESKALFANVKYSLDSFVPGLELDVGLRYTEDEVESCTGNGVTPVATGATHDDCKPGNPRLLNASTTSGKFNETTWSAGLNWQINDDFFAYGVTRHGYRAGGANGPTLFGRLAPYQQFQPETVTDVELGMRLDWSIADVAVRTNVSVFRGEYKDVQSPVTAVTSTLNGCDPSRTDNPYPISVDGDCNVSNDPVGSTLLLNLGESRVSGIDMEVVIVPIEQLTLTLGGNYLDLKTIKFGGDAVIAPFIASSEIPFNYTSKRTFTAGLRYALDLGSRLGRELVANADYYWTDDIFYITEEGSLPSYHLINLRVDLNEVAGSAFDLSFFARNLTDEDYYSNGTVGGGFVGIKSYSPGPPRLYGAELRFSF